jgi:hypothetical protein
MFEYKYIFVFLQNLSQIECFIHLPNLVGMITFKRHHRYSDYNRNLLFLSRNFGIEASTFPVKNFRKSEIFGKNKNQQFLVSDFK